MKEEKEQNQKNLENEPVNTDNEFYKLETDLEKNEQKDNRDIIVSKYFLDVIEGKRPKIDDLVEYNIKNLLFAETQKGVIGIVENFDDVSINMKGGSSYKIEEIKKLFIKLELTISENPIGD